MPNRAPQRFDGFTQITDFDFAPDRGGYLVQYASVPFFSGPGALIHVARNRTRTTITTDLINLTGVTVGLDGAVYVSYRHTVPGGGRWCGSIRRGAENG